MPEAPDERAARASSRHRARLLEEVRQLRGVRQLRLRMFGPQDAAVARLDRMIRERRLQLYDSI